MEKINEKDTLEKNLEKYKQDKNSDELSQKFHERAGNISKDLNTQLLTLSTGIIAAFFLLVFNNKDLTDTNRIFILITIAFFGFSILFSILGMKWDASRNYFLGNINDSTKQLKRTENELLKNNFNTKQKKAKNAAGLIFLLGVLSAIVFLSNYIFCSSSC
jgi:hypothetical protein